MKKRTMDHRPFIALTIKKQKRFNASFDSTLGARLIKENNGVSCKRLESRQ